MLLALTVPASQLTTVSVVKTCCCPDPDNCHCPDHQPDKGTQPSIRACHQQQQINVAPQLPSFTPPTMTLAAPVVVVAIASAITLPVPHVSPAPKRPDAPS